MTGLGLKSVFTLNNGMYYLFWILIVVIAGGAIYWIMDWKNQHPDGE